MHALIEGLTLNSNFRKFASMFKQRSAFEYQQSHGRRLWQDGYYEHTLREHESQIGIAAYIINNPIRASLCTSLENYAYLGSDRFTIRELCDAIQTPPCTRP